MDGENDCELCRDYERFERKQEAEEKEQEEKDLEIDHFLNRKESIDDAYGWFRPEMVREYNYSFGDRDVAETVIETPETVPEQPEDVSESPETVIDGNLMDL